MKIKAIKILGMILLLSMAIPAVYARGPSGNAGKLNVAHLYLVEKDPVGEWPIVEDGAWGKMKYNQVGPTFDFVFYGHGLDLNADYTLIYYPNPWLGTGGNDIASGTPNEKGNLDLMGLFILDSTPIAEDTNDDGAKIWLVLSDDYDESNKMMKAWNPTEYLFEYNLITYDVS